MGLFNGSLGATTMTDPMSIKESHDITALAGTVEWRTTKTLDEMVVELGDAIGCDELQYIKLTEALPRMFANVGQDPKMFENDVPDVR
jgi:hypothetical protein